MGGGGRIVIPKRHELSLMIFHYCLERVFRHQCREEGLRWSPAISLLRKQSKSFRESNAAKISGRLTEMGKLQKENSGDLQRDPLSPHPSTDLFMHGGNY